MPETAKTKPRRRKQCGTPAGYRQHRKRGEEACERCREGHAAYQREYNRKRRLDAAAGKPPAKRREGREAKKERLEAEAAAVTDNAPMDPDAPPAYLKAAGRQLWDEVLGSYDLDLPARSVLAEACRMRDRLERFSAALASQSSLWFELGDPEETAAGETQVSVVVNGMISEARQMQAALAINLGKIGVLRQASAKASGPSAADEMAARREARRAAAAAAAKKEA